MLEKGDDIAMNILITGAGGFVGRNLTEYLSIKYNVFATTHSDLELLDDIAVKRYIETYQIDLIIHCAAVGGSRKTNYDIDSDDIVENNLRMFFNLERCLTKNMRMIHLGSGAEYDRRHWHHKMTEDFFDKNVPADSYGYAKYLISKYIEHRDNMVCLRIFGLFGKYEDYRFKFISNAIVKNLLHMPITIHQNVIFDYLCIDDFVKIIEIFINNQPVKKHYNITPTDSIDLVTIAETINFISDYKSDIFILNNGMNLEYSGNNIRLLTEFFNISLTNYFHSIQNLFKYYNLNKNTLDINIIKKDPYLVNCRTFNYK